MGTTTADVLHTGNAQARSFDMCTAVIQGTVGGLHMWWPSCLIIMFINVILTCHKKKTAHSSVFYDANKEQLEEKTRTVLLTVLTEFEMKIFWSHLLTNLFLEQGKKVLQQLCTQHAMKVEEWLVTLSVKQHASQAKCSLSGLLHFKHKVCWYYLFCPNQQCTGSTVKWRLKSSWCSHWLPII